MPPKTLKSLSLALVLLSIAVAGAGAGHGAHNGGSGEVWAEFEAWAIRHGKLYGSEDEKAARFGVFERNRAFVDAHNGAGDSPFELGLNEFADLTIDEFVAAIGLGLREPAAARVLDGRVGDFMVGPEILGEDRGENFGAIIVETFESEGEQLVRARVFDANLRIGLQIFEEDKDEYPESDDICNNDKIVANGSCIEIPSDIGRLLLDVVEQKPINVSVCASNRYFQLYSKGIFIGPCCTCWNHAVQLVGYNLENGVDYWIVKNSWGSSWGMNGYVHILRNSGNSQGLGNFSQFTPHGRFTNPNPYPPFPPFVFCNIIAHCPVNTTCCCHWRVLGLCFEGHCCDGEGSVCCAGTYCCPPDYPKCGDTTKLECLKVNGTTITGIAMKKVIPRESWKNYEL